MCYFGYILFFSYEHKVYLIIQGIFVLSGMTDISWFFFGIEKFKVTVVRNTIIKIFTIFTIFVFVKDSGDTWKYCLIMALGTFLSQTYLWLYIREYVNFYKPSWNKMKKHFIPDFILFIPIIAVSLYKMMDKIMLGSMSSMIQVGYYESAEKTINIPTGLITVLGTVMLPRMSNLIASGDIKQSKVYLNP